MVVHSIEWFAEQPPSEMLGAVADMRERLIEDSYRQLADIESHQTPGSGRTFGALSQFVFEKPYCLSVTD
jgi:hypothetical protein